MIGKRQDILLSNVVEWIRFKANSIFFLRWYIYLKVELIRPMSLNGTWTLS